MCYNTPSKISPRTIPSSLKILSEQFPLENSLNFHLKIIHFYLISNRFSNHARNYHPHPPYSVKIVSREILQWKVQLRNTSVYFPLTDNKCKQWEIAQLTVLWKTPQRKYPQKIYVYEYFPIQILYVKSGQTVQQTFSQGL